MKKETIEEERKMPFEGHKRIYRPDGSTGDSWFPYKCAKCERDVSGAVVAKTISGPPNVRWLQCTICGDGAVQQLDGNVYPGVAFGVKLEGLPGRSRGCIYGGKKLCGGGCICSVRVDLPKDTYARCCRERSKGG